MYAVSSAAGPAGSGPSPGQDPDSSSRRTRAAHSSGTGSRACVSSTPAPLSASMDARRPAGYSGSSGV